MNRGPRLNGPIVRDDWPWWLRYCLAVVIVVLAAVARAAFFYHGTMGLEYVSFYPAVFLSAFFLGEGPGFLTVGLSALAADCWIPPIGRLYISSPAEVIGMAVFLTTSLMIVWICERQRRSIRRAHQAEDAAHQAEEALHDARYQAITALLEGIGDCFVAFDRDWRYVQVNSAACQALGKTKDELLGKVLWEVFPAADERFFGTEYRRAMKEKVAAHFEEYYPKPLNAWYEVRCYPNSDGLNVFFIDITQRKRTEKALQVSEEKFAAAFSENPAAVTITTLEEGRFVEVNDTWVALTGYSRDETIGRLAHELPLWPTVEARKRFAQELRIKGSLRGWEHDFLKKTGEIFVASLSAQVLAIPGEKLILSTFLDITDRKRAEAALKESEERFRTMANSIPQLAWIAHPDGNIFWFNRRWYDYTGTTPEQVVGWGWQSVHDPEALPNVMERWKASLATGEGLDMEYPLRAADGHFRTFLARVVPLKDSYGRIVQWLGTHTDITERKQAEEKLRRQAELLDLSHDAILIRGLDGVISYWSRGAEQLYGYTREEVIGRISHELIKTVFPQPLAEFEAILLREGFWEGELIHTTRNGARVTVSSRWVLQRDKHGHPMDVLETNTDITEVNRTLVSLRESEERFRVMANSIPQLAWVAGADGFIYCYNQRWYDYTGKTPEEMTGWGWQSVHDPKVLPKVLERWKTSLDTGQPLDMEFPLLGADGHFRPFLTRVVPVRDSQGKVVQWFGTNTDITSRKKMEESLAAANRAKDRFLATLSHELRTPLTPVLAAIQMLEEGGQKQSEAELSGIVAMMRRNVELEARLIDDLLDLTRIARGKVKLDKHPVDLCEIVGRVVEVCKPDIVARRLHFGVDAPACPYWVDADPVRLQQVFWNLLRNAIKFTPADGCVGIRCQSEKKAAVIEVSDSGIGIGPALLERIFIAFEQEEHVEAERFGGLGLGLAISKKLVEMHGGGIAAFSEGKGQGARFRVKLPTAQAPVSARPETIKRTPTTATPGIKRHILLVEDHGDTLRIIKGLLERQGHDVQTAGDVATAIQLADQKEFDLLISDLGLPDRSGLDLMRELRARGEPLPGIALSGYGQEQDIQQSREAGFAVHLVKPVNIEDLKNEVMRVGVASM